MSITNPEIKKLYGLSAGRCAICKNPVFENDVHIGEMAHIIAKSLKGPRGNIDLSYDINSYENLILLCANHHLEVDQNPNGYTVEKLQTIKSSHEEFINNRLEFSEIKNQIEYILRMLFKNMPFTRLLSFTNSLPEHTSLEIFSISDVLEAFILENPHIYPFSDTELQRLFESFRSYYNEIIEFIQGSYGGVSSSVPNFINVDGTNSIRFNRHNLPYEYVSANLPNFRESIRCHNEEYSKLVSHIKSKYAGAFS